jgi:predicted enzyme related to lactoylglutathione lyase
MKPIEIAFSCYAVTNLKRAREFYEGVLNLKPSSVFEKGDMGFVEYELGPHTLAIGAGAEIFKPGPTGATVALEVEDFDAAIASLKTKKVRFVLESYDGPACRMATIADPDGNQIVIHKRKVK